MKIVVPDDYQDVVKQLECFPLLAGHDVTIYNDSVSDLELLVQRFADADAVVLIRERTAIDASLLDRLPRLKLISQTGKGTAHIDLAACKQRGVTVSAGTGSPYAPAELTWALVLAAMRRLPQEANRLRSGGWQGELGRTVRGRTLGIWGYGKIGRLVAGYGKAMGMNVLALGRNASREKAMADGAEIARDAADLFERSDVLSLHLRLVKETVGIVTGELLARMKPDALIVNSSRAELIEQGALERALRAGRPGFAAVDVYEEEPVRGANHPLLALDNALCTPHLGYVEKDSYEMYFGEAFRQVNAFAEGKPINVVG